MRVQPSHFRRSLVFVGILLIAFACQEQASGKSDKTPTTEMEKVSYSIGLDIGRNFKQQGLNEVDVDFVVAGIKAILKDEKPVLSDSQVQAVMTSFQAKLSAKRDSARNAQADENKKAGDKFLEENKTKKGVKVTESGLQYLVMEKGKGESPKLTNKVKCHYRGTLLDGTEFDSSHKRGQPAEFPVNGVIKGWTEALQLMKPGAKWKLFIPSDLAYGPRGAGGKIGPNATLIFEIELLEVKE